MPSRRNFVKNALLGSAAALIPQLPVAAQSLPSTQPARPLRFGVNFVPRKRWWYCWQDWDRQAILDDLHGVAALGCDHIRAPILWSLFQPGIHNVSDRCLANLHSLLDAADQVGIDVEVSVLNGWMSGFSYMPAWVLPVRPERPGENWNIFTSAPVIEGEKFLLQHLADTIGTHKRFLGFDLGNELGVLIKKSNPVSTKAIDAWATDMLSFCDLIAPGKFHVNGVDHSHWFNDFGFSRPNLATTGHATVMHAYVHFDGVLERYPYSGVGSLHLADYMIELGYAYHTDLHRPVWVQEIGVGSVEMPEAYKPEYMDRTIRNIASTGHAWGVTWWCSHDIDRSVQGFSDYEYTLGLLDLQNKPKPMGIKFAALASEFKATPPPAVQRTAAIVIPDTGLLEAGYPPDWRFANVYMSLISQGKLPAIVLASRSHDDAYLKSRGITTLIPCTC